MKHLLPTIISWTASIIWLFGGAYISSITSRKTFDKWYAAPCVACWFATLIIFAALSCLAVAYAVSKYK